MLSKIGNEHLLTRICLLLEPKDIIPFLESNKRVKSKLNPTVNSITNKIFYYGVTSSFFTMEEDDDKTNFAYDEKELLENHWNTKINWKSFFCQINHHFKSYPDKEISEIVEEYNSNYILPLKESKQNYETFKNWT